MTRKRGRPPKAAALPAPCEPLGGVETAEYVVGDVEAQLSVFLSATSETGGFVQRWDELPPAPAGSLEADVRAILWGTESDDGTESEDDDTF